MNEYTQNPSRIIEDETGKQVEKLSDSGHNALEFLTKAQVLELFQISGKTLNHWLSDGLAYVQVGAKKFFYLHDIENFMQKHVKQFNS